MPALDSVLVADFTWYLPGPFASRELLRLGARVVHIEPPAGDPMRAMMPAWDEAINAGKESVVADLKTEDGLALANGICARADVVLDGFRPGVLDRLGVRVPESAVLCAITGFGAGNRHEARAGHDVNYLGYAGVLADTAPALAPVQVADLAAGGLYAALEIVAALYAGGGARLNMSMTHNSHRFVAHRGATGLERNLTGALACYRMYATADGRWLTVGALEPKFWQRLCEVTGRPELGERQFDADQEEVAAELAAAIEGRPLDEWLELFDSEDVCAGPVWTIEEAAGEFGFEALGSPPVLGQHTQEWREALSL